MVIKHIYLLILGIITILSNALSPYQKLNAQETDTSLHINSEYSQFLYLPESQFVVNPFPNYIVSLVQPLDSISSPKNILQIKYDNLETDIVLARDWSTITIHEYIDGVSYKMPFSADVEWYLNKYNERKSYLKLIEIMQKESKDGSSKRKGQMMEVVGMVPASFIVLIMPVIHQQHQQKVLYLLEENMLIL